RSRRSGGARSAKASRRRSLSAVTADLSKGFAQLGVKLHHLGARQTGYAAWNGEDSLPKINDHLPPCGANLFNGEQFAKAFGVLDFQLLRLPLFQIDGGSVELVAKGLRGWRRVARTPSATDAHHVGKEGASVYHFKNP
ncbi:MAG: hypothetical protein WBP15_09020, partial [Tabrizicola sp.]